MITKRVIASMLQISNIIINNKVYFNAIILAGQGWQFLLLGHNEGLFLLSSYVILNYVLSRLFYLF